MSTHGQVAKCVAERKAAHPELYCKVRGCLWHTAELNASRNGYILDAKPCRKHPQMELAHAVQAVADLSEARESHLAWAAHLRQPHTFECEGCVDHASHIGDADYHDEWVAKYDNALQVHERLTGERDRLAAEVERLRSGLLAIAERATAAEHYGYRDLAEEALNPKGQCDACGSIVPVDELQTGMPAAGVEGSFCAKCRGEKSVDQ